MRLRRAAFDPTKTLENVLLYGPTGRAFARLCDDLGLADLRFHDLRHDAASTLTMAGVPQRTVMAILGHRDPRMTMRYQQV